MQDAAEASRPRRVISLCRFDLLWPRRPNRALPICQKSNAPLSLAEGAVEPGC